MEVENFFNRSSHAGRGFTGKDEGYNQAPGFHPDRDNGGNQDIDLNEQLVRNKPATFFMRVSGNSMINAGISEGDIVIVDRSLKAQNGKIVIAVLDGEMLIRRYEQTMNKLRLVPETPKLSTIDVSEFSDFTIWGVVIYVIRSL